MKQELQGSEDSAIRRFSIFTLSRQVCCTMLSQTSNSWRGIPTLWSFYPPWNQTPLYSLSTCGRAEGSREDSREDSLHRMTEQTLTEHVRAVPDAVSLSLKWHQRIHAPCNSLSVILQWAPRALGTTSQILLSYESCPCQDTLCYAFFKKYLVYFFKLRLKYKSQSMGTEF